MTPEQMAGLRAPFPAEQVGRLPKPLRANSEKGNCRECGTYHGLPAVHLDYVGHADITDRLLTVDPDWTWEPMGRTADGLPALDGYGNLWINLTIHGVTRPGVGDGKSMKECVGDALRNAAMRFGVALDLWAKGDRSFGLAGHDAPAQAQTGPSVREQVLTAAKSRFTGEPAFLADFKEQTGHDFGRAPASVLSEYLAHLAPFTAAPDVTVPVTESLAPEDSSAGQEEPETPTPPTSAATPARQGPDDPPKSSQVADLRDKALAATKKPELLRLLMEVGKSKVGEEMTSDESGRGMSLEQLINARIREVAA